MDFMNYDWIIIGSGLYGATFARLKTNQGYKCIILEKRDVIGGNCFDYKQDNYYIHKYGPHIFHTSNDEVWSFVNRYTKFNNYINQTLANNNGKLYHLPFNMNTFYELFGSDAITPEQAMKTIEMDKSTYTSNGDGHNLMDHAISMVGPTIYHTLIEGYTKKQWCMDPSELSPDIIKRLPLRFTYDNNYFNDKYQGIPIDGYTNMITNIINGVDYDNPIDIVFNYNVKEEDISKFINYYNKNVLYTGPVDELCNYKFGKLSWRSLSFANVLYNKKSYQGNAIINYTNENIPYTRSIEHKYFYPENIDNNIETTLLTYEFPSNWEIGLERYYPINNDKNELLHAKYIRYLCEGNNNFFIGGRLGQYKYFDMDDTILKAMNDIKLYK